MQDKKAQNFIKGAAILAAAQIFVKIVGAIYKIPLYNILDDTGIGTFQSTYNVYMLVLAIATAGIPVALSRMVSSAAAIGNERLVKRYFKVGMPAFFVIGIAAMLAMFFFADRLAGAMNNSLAAPGIRVLAPATLFACVISVYRGYAQGFENMMPTAASQAVEVVGKAVFGIAIAVFLSRAAYEVEIISAGAIMGVTIGLGICIPLLAWYKRKIDRNVGTQGDASNMPGSSSVLWQIMKVSIPIAIGSSFMGIITVIDNSLSLGRLQNVLELSEPVSVGMIGVYAKGLTLYNLPPALVVPVCVSLVPAIAAALARKQGSEARGIMQSSLKLVNLFTMPACAGLMVLPSPILFALYQDSGELAANILVYLGAASFFLCLQLVTTAILQANGNERLALLAIPIGGAVKIALVYYLVGIPEIGILGSAISSLACFVVICVLNFIFIMVKVKERPKLGGVFIKPLICTAVMAALAYLVYTLVHRLGSGLIGEGRFAIIVFLAVAIVVAIAAYGVLIIVTRTVTMEDMKLVPKGEKIAKILRIK